MSGSRFVAEPCDYCGRTLPAGRPTRTTIRLADGTRVPVHGTCYHRMTASDGCGCDICTGDIH